LKQTAEQETELDRYKINKKIKTHCENKKIKKERCARDNSRGQKSLGPPKMSLEMAQKVIVPQKKNYVPQFLKGTVS
jgi:hypothetical protein